MNKAARRTLRLTALLLLVLAGVAACAATPTNTPAGREQTRSPTPIVTTSAVVCRPPSRPSLAGGCVVDDAAAGISLRVTNAYADVTSTVVQLETSNTDDYPVVIYDPQVALQSGQILQTASSDSGTSVSFVIDEPVPPEDFGSLVHLVATAHFGGPGHQELPPTLPPTPARLNDLDHITLSVPFEITPVRSGDYAYQQAPVVKQGIGVQVQSLDISPARGAFYGAAGGARVELVFSGLPADMELLSFIRLQSLASFPSVGVNQLGDYSQGLVELHIPGMTVSTPALTFLQNPVFLGNPQILTVGSAGTVKLEVSYQGGGVPTGQAATLSISHIQLLTGDIDGNSSIVPVLPTYQITLPLS